MKVLMIGVDSSTQGGMWTVVDGYLKNRHFCQQTGLIYIPTSITGNVFKKLLFTMKAYMKIFITLIGSGIDLVHIHVSERGSIYRKYIVLKLAKIFKCKVVLHMHGAEFQEWYEHLTLKRQKHIQGIFEQADKVIILGDYWKDFVSTIVNEKKIEVIHNAVKVSDQNNYNSSANCLLFLGVVGKRKGIDDLLAAMVKADDRLSEDVKLIIYGPDPEGNINHKIEQQKIEHRVEYKGWLSNEEKQEVFKRVAIHILPSYNEGLPMSILETMAYGIPNISTRIAAIPEAVTDKNGILIQPGDVEKLAESIVFLMETQKERIEKSENTFKDINEGFSIDSHIMKVLRIYEKLESGR